MNDGDGADFIVDKFGVAPTYSNQNTFNWSTKVAKRNNLVNISGDDIFSANNWDLYDIRLYSNYKLLNNDFSFTFLDSISNDVVDINGYYPLYKTNIYAYENF